MRFCAIELTAPQSSDPRVTSTVAVLRTPARPYVSSTSHVDMEFNPMKNLIARFVKDESGATAIEYGLIAGLIAVVVVTSITTLGTKLTNTFTNVSNKL